MKCNDDASVMILNVPVHIVDILCHPFQIPHIPMNRGYLSKAIRRWEKHYLKCGKNKQYVTCNGICKTSS